MAADVIAAAGVAVTVYERMPTVGRKLLMAGRGGLNLTHSEPLAALLARYGPARSRLEPMLLAFPPARLVAFAHDLGQETFTGSSGRVFPRAMKASPLLRAWLARLGRLGVAFATGHRWTGLSANGGLLLCGPDGSREITVSAVVLALGGASWPRLGSDGAWQPVVTGWGVGVAPLAPANCGVEVAWSEHMLRHAGAPLKRIAIRTADGVRAAGEAVVTRGGLEGGAVYGLVPAIRAKLAGGGQAAVTVDLRPNETEAALAARLARPRGKASMATFLARALDLAPVSRSLLHETAGRTLPATPVGLARLIKAVPLTVIGLAGLERAISSAGGIPFDEIDDAMMVRRRPGVFVAGEMLDWEAPTGGYLLQGAFATGHAAGEGVLRWLGARGSVGAMGEAPTGTAAPTREQHAATDEGISAPPPLERPASAGSA